MSLFSDQPFETWFEEVYKENFERLFRYAYSISKDKQVAEDAVADVFTNIWTKPPNHRMIEEIKSYLSVSVKHQVLRLISKDLNRFNYSSYDQALQISQSITPENLLIGRELDDAISSIVKKASPKAQIIYDLAKNKGLSNQEVADEMGLSKRMVENQLYQILKSLKECIASQYDSDKPTKSISKWVGIGVILLSALFL